MTHAEAAVALVIIAVVAIVATGVVIAVFERRRPARARPGPPRPFPPAVRQTVTRMAVVGGIAGFVFGLAYLRQMWAALVLGAMVYAYGTVVPDYLWRRIHRSSDR